MMAFITHYLRSAGFDLGRLLVAVCLCCGFGGAVWAETPSAEISLFRIERDSDAIVLSVGVKFELSAAVQDALLKGVSVVFLAEAEIFRERWYWTNKRVVSAERRMRLSYQPLTRRWRLNVASGVQSLVGLGVALNQSFDTLPEALAALQRLSRWKIAEVAELDLEQRHLVEFRFRMDLSQLPRPFQIGTLGQTDWNIAASSSQGLVLDNTK